MPRNSTARKKEAGQALIAAMAALGVVLMGFAGLGIDVGVMRYEKRLQQTAADSAALAGAAELPYSGAYVAAAQHSAASNGFTDGTNNATVAVHSPPLSGPHTGVSGYVEVTVAQVQPTFFMRILGINNQTVTARAVAYGNANASGCIYALGNTNPAINLGINFGGGGGAGGVHITANNCGVVDNGGLLVTGGSNLTANSIGVAPGSGEVIVSPGSGTNPAAATGIVPAPDPLAYLTPPAPSSPCTLDPNIGNGATLTLPQGTYCSLTIGGGAHVTLNGLYIVTGNITVNNGANVTGGSGVTLYETAGALNLAGGGNFNLTAPTSGALAGILFWQAASDTTAATINNGFTSSLTGALYLPGATLNLAGGVNVAPYSIVVAQAISLTNGTSLTTSGDYSSLPGGSPIKTAQLVE